MVKEKENDLYFKVMTPLEFEVRTTRSYWNVIIGIKHPNIAGEEMRVQETLKLPDTIRRSRQDSNVFLFYKRRHAKHLCVVVKRQGSTGFIITAYFTDNIKEGERVWKK